MLYQFQRAKQKAKQKSLSFLMWSEAYDNFQIIYIEAHPTKGTFAINT